MNSKKILSTAVLLALVLFLITVPAIAQYGADAISVYHLLIIAPDEFIEELQPLKRFKDASARPTTLLSLTQVYSSFTEGDDAERVKRCIAYYEQTFGIHYVMLVGDVDKFPVRWRWWGRPGEEYWGVSDLYYADLYKYGTKTFDDWDLNNNGLYGEIEFYPDGTINNDWIDFLPDVAVGRVPASSDDEVEAYVNKVINYEMTTQPSNDWFKKAGLYTGNWSSGANTLQDDIGAYLENQGFSSIKRYWDFGNDQPPLGVPGAIINDMNSGVGFANYVGHGNIWGWANLGFGSAQLTGLNNSDKLPVAFGAACETGYFAPMARFQPYKDLNGQGHCGTILGEVLDPGPYPHVSLPKPAPLQDGQVFCDNANREFDHWCFAEPFIFGSPTGPTGAIAYLGERTGGQSGALELDRYFFEAYDKGNKRVLGDMWMYMIEKYFYHYNLMDSHWWWFDPEQWQYGHIFDEPQKMILFGDPSLVAGGAFTITKSGTVYDVLASGPLFSYWRYRITGDVTVPTGETLTVYPYASVLFNDGKKITALGTASGDGLVVDGTPDEPVYFMSLGPDPQSERVVQGIKVKGQLRVRNGGQIKLQ